MLLNYLKIAIRRVRNNKLISFINVFGLGLSMSVCMMEMIIVQTETSYDRFHPHPDRTYRILSRLEQNDGNQFTLASTPLPLSAQLREDGPALEALANIYPAFNGKAISGERELDINGAFTDPSFFKVFGFTLAQGSAALALSEPNSVVLSKATAERFFPSQNAIGKVLALPGKGSFRITGVLNKTPGRSHIDFDAYASSSSLPTLEMNKSLPAKSNDWNDAKASYTYVLLKEGVRAQALENTLSSLALRLNKDSKGGHLGFSLQSIQAIRPSPDNILNDIGGGTSWGKLWVGINVSLVILLAACFNYVNLTVARALTRAREIGVRKISGARRSQIFSQYIIEAVVLSALALLFAWLLLAWIVRYAPFNDEFELIPSSWNYNLEFISATLLFSIFTALVAGVAPAWILSSFKPIAVLKNLKTTRHFGKLSVQRVLIVFQYSLSLVIIIFLFTFYRQFSFLGKRDPGFDTSQIVVLPLNGVDAKLAQQEIAAVPGVQAVAAMSDAFTSHYSGVKTNVRSNLKQKTETLMNLAYADAAFIPTMKMKLIAGRNFDAVNGNIQLIINERAAQALGFSNASQALGQSIWLNDSTSASVTGVLENFNYEKAGKPIDPLGFRTSATAYRYLYLKTNTSERTALMERLKLAWSKFGTPSAFGASWLKEDIDHNNSQSATVSLLSYLAFMAISIASLGLLGLVMYTVETRRKEIAIRKVIGAGERELMRLLSLRFVKLLLVAGLIAVPIGYVFSYLFLQNFLVRVGWLFPGALLCFCFLLAVGLITILSQTYRASIQNPVQHLRAE